MAVAVTINYGCSLLATSLKALWNSCSEQRSMACEQNEEGESLAHSLQSQFAKGETALAVIVTMVR